MAAENNDSASWFELAFSRGLTEPALILGVPKTALMYNGLTAIFFLLNFKFWQILPISLIVHCLMIYICKGDNRFFDCLQSYIHKKKYYST